MCNGSGGGGQTALAQDVLHSTLFARMKGNNDTELIVLYSSTPWI